MRLRLIRHAEAIGNAGARMLGRQDQPLTADGLTQAEQLGKQWQQTCCWRPQAIWTSPLQRAQQTAIALSQGQTPVIPLLVQPALTEIDLGCLTGLTWPEAEQRYPDLCQQLLRDRHWRPIPEAETLSDCRLRAEQVCTQLIHTEADLWVISHGGFLQHLLAALLGCDRSWGLDWPLLGAIDLSLAHEDWDTAGRDRWNTSLWRWQILHWPSRSAI
ncbi:histidine phosphatase family protein [Synechococcus elongatus]|uniref:histidine phosphatase family protein n=1 Tax=Synechococcus elongatus TaxID=32046 RepID=UPI000F7D5CF6|nr:histidine phosphatase family protein [Synechococcus elongatus]